MRRRIEKYFEYYWTRDLNYAMKSEEGQRFISELPKEIRVNIYKDFLFNSFLYKFRVYFKIPTGVPKNCLKLVYLTWSDRKY